MQEGLMQKQAKNPHNMVPGTNRRGSKVRYRIRVQWREASTHKDGKHVAKGAAGTAGKLIRWGGTGER